MHERTAAKVLYNTINRERQKRCWVRQRKVLGNSREVLGRGGKREYTSSVEKAAIHKNGEPKTPPFPVAYDSNLEKNILDEPALAIATEPVYDASLVPQYIAWRRGTLPHCCCILCKSVNFTNWTILHKDVD